MPPPHSIAGASFFPLLAWAANVEYSCFRWSCPQEGHSTPFDSALRRTSFSNRVPQSSQVYSKIGILFFETAGRVPPTSNLPEKPAGVTIPRFHAKIRVE